MFSSISKFKILQADEVFLTVKRESTLILLRTAFNQKQIAKVRFKLKKYYLKFSLYKIHVTTGRSHLSETVHMSLFLKDSKTI